MTYLPMTDHTPGLYVVLEAALTDEVIAIPGAARAVALWFEVDGQPTAGLIGLGAAALVTGLTATTTKLAHHPQAIGMYSFIEEETYGERRTTATHLHLAAFDAGVIARGQWLY